MIRVGLFGRLTVTEPKVWGRLPARQRVAVIAHEQGHIRAGHTWKRLLARLFLSRKAASDLMHAQEYEADAYAKKVGHGPALVCVLLARPEQSSYTHPSTRERVAKLLL